MPKCQLAACAPHLEAGEVYVVAQALARAVQVGDELVKGRAAAGQVGRQQHACVRARAHTCMTARMSGAGGLGGVEQEEAGEGEPEGGRKGRSGRHPMQLGGGGA